MPTPPMVGVLLGLLSSDVDSLPEELGQSLFGRWGEMLCFHSDT